MAVLVLLRHFGRTSLFFHEYFLRINRGYKQKQTINGQESTFDNSERGSK
jgi:hypothetical protein